MSAKIIDTHVHVWNFEQAEYDWLKGDTSMLNRSYFIEELEQARKNSNVVSGVLVQAANNIEDTDWMLSVASETDWIAGVVGWLPLMNPDATEKLLKDKYLQNPWFKGVRHLIHNESNPEWLLQQQVTESLRILTDLKLPYDLVGILPGHIETALKVAAKLPDLRMVFDHLNQPPISTKDKFGRWGSLMTEAAKHPNFYMKISGLGTTSGNFRGWSKNDIEPYIEFTLKHFGEDRCFLGGDWPVSLLAGEYQSTIKAYTQVLDSLLSKENQSKVQYTNAKEFYSLNIT